MPSAFPALGEVFAECPTKNTRQIAVCRQKDAVCCMPSDTLGKAVAECFWAIAECPWHSAKRLYPVVGHGHRRLAPRSAFDDRLVGVGLLNDSTVIYFYPCRIIRIVTVLDVCTTNGAGDNKTINDL